MSLYGNDAESVDVGSRLRELRELRGISMRSLAEKSGLSANALSMIERGKTSPSVEHTDINSQMGWASQLQPSSEPRLKSNESFFEG